MSIYKLTIEKTVFVRAKNEDEAKDLDFDDEYIMIDQRITDVSKSNKKEMQKMMFGGDEE